MNRRGFLARAFGAGAAWAGSAYAKPGQVRSGGRKPNFVVILTDDQGYGDVGCYGAEGFETPNLDRMAAEGMRFTDFYSVASVCTPSRAALLTGCYAQRVGLPSVLNPKSDRGLHADEVTIAEVLKGAGYTTGCIGKWHLGHHPEFLPVRHGFDVYFGLPYSNDMGTDHAGILRFPEIPLMEQGRVLERSPDQRQLTTQYTERAVSFIEANREGPFFLYLAHTMPHVPLHVSEKFAGKSERGLYGDVIMEIDWSVGQVLDALERCGIDENTVVLFTSDNGPWLGYGEHAGSAGGLREGKGTTFEGGHRTPCIVRWPGKVPAGGHCRELCASFDLFPTLAGLAGVPVPQDRGIDGKSIAPLILGKAGAGSPHEALFFLLANRVQAVRSGPWKLHLPHSYMSVAEPGVAGEPGRYESNETPLALYHVVDDPGETRNLADAHGETAGRLAQMARDFEADLRAHRRPPGKIQRERRKK